MNHQFDIIIVGAGHAGVEASLVCAKKGLNTLVVTTNLERIAHMSCNPSIGGLAKGHMVRELDVLGGEMGRAADATCVQHKRLNAKKGPAVRGTRFQCDKSLYNNHMSDVLEKQENLSFLKGEVKSLILKNRICCGVKLGDGSDIYAKAVIITAGTFMNGVMHVGEQKISGGRVGDQSTSGLSDQLRENGFSVLRLKTGTPPRLDKESIHWDKTEIQYGDKAFYPFSLSSKEVPALPQIACFITRTTEETHEIIRKNLHLSPLYGGMIEGTGPRYCPSIEDKVIRFEERLSHQTFLEPEGLNTNSIYIQGISTSLPENVQQQFLKTIPGLEDVRILRAGYAVEYDFIEPTQIWHTLETRQIENLFLAGQINGTSGYEEAAVQGFVAGLNAVCKIRGDSEFILERDEAYIGVLIDDLVTKGTKEPYRMFTSRAEHRLVLREDNTKDRLLEIGFRRGVLAEDIYREQRDLLNRKATLLTTFKKKKLTPTEATQSSLRKKNSPVLLKPTTFEELLRRSEISCYDLCDFDPSLKLDERLVEPLEIEVKYQGYIKRQFEIIRQSKKMEGMKLEMDLPYNAIHGLSNEEKEKLSAVKPRSIGQAQRISGVNPSAIQAILVYLKGIQRRQELNQ